MTIEKDLQLKALRYLARRDHSSRELKQKLQQHFPHADLSNVLRELKDHNLQSDERFAYSLIKTRIQQGYGPKRIVFELKTHQLDGQAFLNQFIAEMPVDWLEQAERMLLKHFGNTAPQDNKDQQKRRAYLYQRGFDESVIKAMK